MDTWTRSKGRGMRGSGSGGTALNSRQVIEACRHPGVSIAAVALDHRLNANMLRIWVAKAQRVGIAQPKPTVTPAFVPVSITPPKPKPDIVIDIVRGAAKVQVRWPSEAAADCAALLRDWLQ